jgi:hypothetical protein
MTDDENKGIRGDGLADEGGGPGVAPNAPADGGLRGDGLAEDAGGRTPPHGDELAEGGVRGDGLAEDAG